MEFLKVLQGLVSVDEQTPERAKLCSAKRLSQIQDPHLREFLSRMYRNEGRNAVSWRLAASVLNTIFRERKATFLFSKSILRALIAGDPNLRRKTISGSDFSKLCDFLRVRGLCQTLRDFDRERNAAGVWELSNSGLLSEFDKNVGRDFRQLQKDNCIKVFDAYVAGLPSKLPGSASHANAGANENTNAVHENPKQHPQHQGDEEPRTWAGEADSPGDQAYKGVFELVKLEHLAELHEEGAIVLTDWEAEFVRENAIRMTKNHNALTERKRTKLLEILSKYSSAIESDRVQKNEEWLYRFALDHLADHPTATDAEVEIAYRANARPAGAWENLSSPEGLMSTLAAARSTAMQKANQAIRKSP